MEGASRALPPFEYAFALPPSDHGYSLRALRNADREHASVRGRSVKLCAHATVVKYSSLLRINNRPPGQNLGVNSRVVMDIAYPHKDNMRRLHLHRGILILLMTMRVMSGEVAAAASHDHPRGHPADAITQDSNTGPSCDERFGSDAGDPRDPFGSGQHSAAEDTKHDREHAGDSRCQTLCTHVHAIASSPQPQCLINIVLFEPAKMPLAPASTMSDVLLRPPA